MVLRFLDGSDDEEIVVFSQRGQRREEVELRADHDARGRDRQLAVLVTDLPDVTCWIVRGAAPAFLRSEGPPYFMGPVWRIDVN